jgi:hypothetical protein
MLLPCEEPAAALLSIAVSGVDSACVGHLRHLRGPDILQHAGMSRDRAFAAGRGPGCCVSLVLGLLTRSRQCCWYR